MTELLYYTDAYIEEFDARVLSVEKQGEAYIAVLDKTAFFPEEGGQYSDTGFVGDARVLDAKIKNGVVFHMLDREVAVGSTLHCKLDFGERYEKMQCHSAEHLLCGLLHKHFGCDNVGFHLGRDYVTFDISIPLSREQLDQIEDEANRAVYENREIFAAFPTGEELSGLEYRSKLEMTENVRIVTIDGYDSCACCAPHVRRTGEIGVIKMLDAVSHRGGLRIYLAAGSRALRDYRARYVESQKISAMLSEPQKTISDAVARQSAALADAEARLAEARRAIAALYIERLSPDAEFSVAVLDGFSPNDLREYAKLAKERHSGYAVALSGEDGAYKYAVAKRGASLGEEIKKINAALCGVGGGRGEIVQGSFSATLSDIENYFRHQPKN